MPRLLLINPSNESTGLGKFRSIAWPPLNLPYLAALTPDHYEIKIIDENVESFKFMEADIVGITALTSTVTRGYKIAQMYREQGITTVMGGIHVSMMPEEALCYSDAVVIGEAESVWPKLLQDFENGRLEKQYHGVWMDLDNLPTPRRDLLRSDYYKWGSIQTSRGCPMNCSFCSVTTFSGKRVRRRPLEDVISELEQIPQEKIAVSDDNIIGHSKKDRAWAKALFTRIIEKGIKKRFFVQSSIQFGEDPELIKLAAKAGVTILFIGIESVNPDSLKSYQKQINLTRNRRYHQLLSSIRKSGILINGAFIVGGDEDDLSIFHTTLKFIESSKIDILQITKPTPLPGTGLWKQLSGDNRILDTDFPKAWMNYRFTKMVFKPHKMSIDDVYEGFTYLKIKYYGFWGTVKRTLATLLSSKSITSTIIAYAVNQSYKKGFLNSEHYKIYRNKGLKRKFQNLR